MLRSHFPLLTISAALLLTTQFGCGDDADSDNTPNIDADAGTDAGADTAPADGSTDTPDTTSDTGAPDALPDTVEPEPFPDEACDDSLRPVVMAHGFLASGDTYGAHFQRFSANGYCRDRLFAYDWNTLGQGQPREATLDAFIDAVLAETGATQVDLAGHSAGGGLGYDYLANAERAAKVAHYAHIGSFANDAPAGPGDAPVPTLNLYSSGDTIVAEGADIPDATNVMLTDEDHYGVATSAASFTAIYTHFNDGQAPATTDIVPEERLQVSGRALTLGENIPASGAAIEIHAVNADTGLRTDNSLVASLTAEEDGSWGPVELNPGEHYEFFVTPVGDAAVPIHYYREPFVRSNTLVYLRTLPDPTSLAGILLAGLPFADDATILVNFTSSTGILVDRDSLTIGGIEMSTEELASADQTTIALFLYDTNGNGESDATTAPDFAAFPFLNGFDQYLPADPTQSIEVNLNGRILHAPLWRSLTDGVTITIFD